MRRMRFVSLQNGRSTEGSSDFEKRNNTRNNAPVVGINADVVVLIQSRMLRALSLFSCLRESLLNFSRPQACGNYCKSLVAWRSSGRRLVAARSYQQAIVGYRSTCLHPSDETATANSCHCRPYFFNQGSSHDNAYALHSLRSHSWRQVNQKPRLMMARRKVSLPDHQTPFVRCHQIQGLDMVMTLSSATCLLLLTTFQLQER